MHKSEVRYFDEFLRILIDRALGIHGSFDSVKSIVKVETDRFRAGIIEVFISPLTQVSNSLLKRLSQGAHRFRLIDLGRSLHWIGLVKYKNLFKRLESFANNQLTLLN